MGVVSPALVTVTPGARLASAIELLAAIASSAQPADGVVRSFYRKRRFIGSKDRRAISAQVYGVLRHQARLDWWLAEVGGQTGSARGRTLVAQLLLDGQDPAVVEGQCDGSKYHPAPLSSEERDQLARLACRDFKSAEQPPAVRCELPDWVFEKLSVALGEPLESEMAALTQEPTVDLRVNSLKATREDARNALASEGIEAEPTPWSPLGLRLTGRHNLPATQAFRDGLVEVQDEGSQLVALLCDVEPGMAVADLCAGAGGKTLALAALLKGQGRLVALDRDESRLRRAAPRLDRAGATDVELQPVAGASDPWLTSNSQAFDRVLVDAPCSGSGAWRRHPDARWRLTPDQLTEYQAAQAEVLDMGAGLVMPGGRLIYATCSLLPEENQHQVAAFLDRHRAFALSPIAPLVAEHLAQTPSGVGVTLQLTPFRHNTDGFFVAILERRAES